ncbi:6-phosphofructokinase [Lacrimispora saccharolytica]|uniref:Pyrophosphate--fructose 6-phosphate 1-phosphotransferase n=1 Tax=Lacrimispora saccharolytica (strain ATCC 35040 / DSM 2544 / NRCC 2533 / WM1) TaxID=610130 RepID=D9R3A2_LACSW|nr:6-phosphofructokinase [Lacrimispora saccharolytica]ADL04851.1 phosphofructokinase [[Clostridium] saccharolyticum WM1]QRV20939.1 6-phosphofructokinase [Lacrimispora saccharolytica]
MKKNAIVGQSGGPTAVINASLYGVIKEGMAQAGVSRVYGMINGIEGFMSDNYMDLSNDLTEEELELLKLTPAAYLGSCRYKLPDNLSSPLYPALFEKFRALEIGYFFYIGGNDSMDTVSKLSRYAAHHNSIIRFIGIPKTIDNDLILTDHTPGYGSAAKYVADTVREIVLDSSVYQQKSVTIIELMGRHAGWLTAASALARKFKGDNPVLIYLPETDFDFERFASDVKAALNKHSTVIICISEGLSDAKGKFICEYADEVRLDTFGHKMLTGSGKMLENFVRDRFGVKVRSIELNVNQRCSGMLASATDIEESVQAGSQGVKAALNGFTGKMVAFCRTGNSPYSMECTTVDVNQVCNQEKLFPAQWICSNGTDVTPDFLEYVLPLIQGEPNRKIENGRPVYLYRK